MLEKYDCETLLGPDDAIDSESLLPLRVLRGAQKVGLERTHFWNTLSYFIQQINYRPPTDRQVQILDLACGSGRSSSVLNEYFGLGKKGYPSSKAKVIGIDIDENAINQAIAKSKHTDLSLKSGYLFVLPNYFEFIQADATIHLDAIPSVSKQTDVILIRHQQISADNRGSQTWKTIFEQALNHLSPDGILILTSFTEMENKMLLQQLKNLNATILVNEKNPHAMPLSQPEIAADNFVTIVKRRD